MSSFKLRPHHALCIQNFRGNGYSPQFTANMTSLIQTFEKDNPQITLQTETDILCIACPHNQQGRCRSYDHVLELDNRFLQQSSLPTKIPIAWQGLKANALSIINNKDRFHFVCFDCSWYELCVSILKNNL